MDEYISREEAVKAFCEKCRGYFDGHCIHRGKCDVDVIQNAPAADVQPVKNGYWIEYERLIGIFGTLCDYMVDNGRCNVFCPYAETKDKNDECEAWRTIKKIRRKG